MSRLRRQPKLESLDLLLDTMCDTLGGIVMIALLIALLSKDGTTDAGAALRAENLREELTRAEQQAAEAERLQSVLVQNTDTNNLSAIDLLTQRDELQRQIEENRHAIQSNTVAQAVLAASGDPAEAEKLIAQQKLAEPEANKLREQIERVKQARQRPLRLPRERVTGKKTFYFVLRHAKIYPVHWMREGRREINTEMLDWTSAADGQTATPKPDTGLDLPGLARFLNDVPGATYSIHFLVYDDSFPAFLNARSIPLARGFDTGWEFLPQNRPVLFSSRGEAPPAL